MRGQTTARRSRPGFALGLAIVCLAVLGLIGGAILSITARERRVLGGEAERLQAVWLAESGVEIAAARLAGDAEWGGEGALPFAISPDWSGRVSIEVSKPEGAGERRVVRVVAEYPVEGPTPRKAIKQVEMDLSQLREREPKS